MSFVPNPRLVFNRIPNGLPIPGTIVYDEIPRISPDTVDLCGGILLKTLALSLDPYMRNRMRPRDVPGDMPPFSLGESITGFGVAVILRSENPGFQAGQHVYGFMPFQRFSVIPGTSSEPEGMPALGLQVIDNELNLPWRYFVGAAGMTGQTAYYGLKDISDPKPGETLYVSAAAGAVGQMVVQLATQRGLKVIASAGRDDKVAMVKELGAHHAFNYKTCSVVDELKAHGPIDIYFDNVGGSTLEAAIENAAMHARFVICGMVSQYNHDMQEAYGIRNLWLVNRHRIKIQGLVVIDWHPKYSEEFYEVVCRGLSTGELKYKEHIYHGLQAGTESLYDLMTGVNLGKAVIVLEDTDGC